MAFLFKRRKNRSQFIPVEGDVPTLDTPNATLFDVIKAEIDKIITTWEDAKADSKISLSEIWTMVHDVVGGAVRVAEAWGGSGVEKKAAVIAALDVVYDEVIAPIDIKLIPNFIEGSIDRVAKQIFLQIVDGLVDAIVALLNRESDEPSAFTE
jgi:hypothetical protein